MTMTELQAIADRHCIFECEMENVIDFVRDFLEAMIIETEKNEPYAVNSIRSMEQAIREVDNLIEVLWEIDE